MATIRQLVERADLGDDIRERTIEVGEPYEPCDLLIADPDRSNGAGWNSIRCGARAWRSIP
ncbi:hypothetical protein V2I01_03595 [Micromonospora sp. BRA006-A]|nr:hypothetical protein [Micromonospora sp. BRA006-A]